ncbi:MAG: hypothetical protein HC854_18130 [Flavobacterium sp.]|nr:hypothetical protein [Flavobacterium sp.]
MKKVIYTLTGLLIISSLVISYMSIDLKQEYKNTEKKTIKNHIVILKEGSSYNPLLILKKRLIALLKSLNLFKYKPF